ncbi:MAG: TrmH family RNA methyltransferase, partial [Deltaproteobacteria bacterium]|nr:TrmH family RNA methyltransferase [Deltaproteobacteria bacterium]
MAYVPPIGLPLETIRAELNRIRFPLRIAVRRSKNAFNIGAIIRTAHSFLVKEIWLIGCEPWYERAAMGMHRYENIREIESEEAFVEVARKAEWHLSVFEKDHAQVGLWDAALPYETCIVIGNEDEGVGPVLLEAASEIIAIPMYGINHSYPMTVA